MIKQRSSEEPIDWNTDASVDAMPQNGRLPSRAALGSKTQRAQGDVRACSIEVYQSGLRIQAEENLKISLFKVSTSVVNSAFHFESSSTDHE